MGDYEQDQRPDNYHYDPYSYYNAKPKKNHTGLLVVLVILALLTGAASWAVNVLGVRIDMGQKGMAVTVGEAPSKETSSTSREMEAISEPAESAEVENLQPETPETQETPTAQVGLSVGESPVGVENCPTDQADALSLQEIYAKVIPSVASISCITQTGTATGTGIVMSEDGYVITNYHVVEDAHQIYVLLGEDSQYDAVMVGGDETTDLAVLKVEATDLVPAEFGDSDVLRVGDMVVAIGDPLGTELRGTMTDGIVSAINRDLNLSGRQMTLIQTNAALNSGNSGGPLINCYGQVIGINTMKMSSYSSTSETVEGLGFAIPITSAKPIVDELIRQGYVSGRPAIGIQAQTLDLRAQFFYNLPSGVIVTGVVRDSDAAEKGLATDDVIVAVNETEINSLEDLVAAKNNLVAGDTVALTVYRGGGYYRVNVELMDQISTEIY